MLGISPPSPGILFHKAGEQSQGQLLSIATKGLMLNGDFYGSHRPEDSKSYSLSFSRVTAVETNRVGRSAAQALFSSDGYNFYL